MTEPLEPQQLPAQPQASGKKCPHCKNDLIEHSGANPYKAGAFHCNWCGGCWDADLQKPRREHFAPWGYPVSPGAPTGP